MRPPGIGHLEDPDLSEDLTVAREFDRGQTGPPMYMNVDFIAGGLVELVGGIASAVVLFGFTWWAPFLLVGAWSATHWLLRESGVWRDRNTAEVRSAQRHADYAYQLAVEPARRRNCGCSAWRTGPFSGSPSGGDGCSSCSIAATRLRERPMIWSLLIVAVANGLVFWALGAAAIDGRLELDRLVVFAQVAIGVSMIAFGGLNWALDGAAAPVAAVQRLQARDGTGRSTQLRTVARHPAYRRQAPDRSGSGSGT